MARIGVVGLGEIASRMVEGLAGQGHEIIVTERSRERSAALARALPEVRVAATDAVVAGSDVVILALMAGTAREVLPELPFRADQRLISVMADLPLAELSRLCAPAGEIAITIPLPFIARGGCPLPVYPDSPALRELFGAANPVRPVASEAALNAHFIATALCSTVLDQLRVGSGWLAGHTGDGAAAEAYVLDLIGGYLGDLARTEGEGRIAAALLALSTPGGLNATLRDRLRDAGLAGALEDGMRGLEGRLGL